MSLRRALSTLLPLVAVACTGLTDSEDAAVDHHDEDGAEPIGTVSSELTATSLVSEAVTAGCSTTSVKALALQLVDEIQCLKPGSMKRIDNVSGISLGAAVFPYMQTSAADALIETQKARGATLTLNSGLRTLPQQYLLYRWYQTGRCGIAVAAKPGTSNHESGIAVDIQDSANWRTTMASEGYKWLGSHDPMHYDFTGGSVNMKGLSVLAFQRLWNRNNPNDTIAEDGVYGPATESRLAKSPVGGFPVGANCSQPMSAPLAPTGGDSEQTVSLPDAPEPAGDTDDAPSVSGQRLAPSIDSEPEATASQGCTVARGANTRVAFGAPLALALVGASLVARRRRPR